MSLKGTAGKFCTKRSRVMTAPSQKTSYVIVGENPGPKKMEKISELKVKTLDEDGFYDLINRTKGDPPKKVPVVPLAKKKSAAIKVADFPAPIRGDEPNQLWTDKYKPSKYSEVIGNKSLVTKLADWLNQWSPKNNSGINGDDRDSKREKVIFNGELHCCRVHQD